MLAVGLTPLTFAMIGLIFALWANGMNFLGAFPEKEGQSSGTGQGIAVAANLVGFITLTFQGVWFVAGAPFGTEGFAVQAQLLFSAVALMYGLLWLGSTLVVLRGWDMRVVGQLALLCFFLQVIEIAIIAKNFRPWTGYDTGIEIALALYLPVLLGFYLLTHGRTTAKWVGVACLAAAAGSAWLAFVPTGIFAGA